MSEKRFERWNDYSCKVKDNQEETLLNWEDIVNKLNKQQDTIDEQKIAIDELITDYKKLEKENEQLKEENEQLKKSEKINMEYAEQIVEENQKLRIAKNDLRREKEQLQKKNEQLRKELDNFKPVIFQDMRKGTVILYTKKFDNNDEVLDYKEAIIQVLELENENLRKQVKSLETTSDATSNYNAHLESKITTLEKENEQLRKQIQNYEQLISNSYVGEEETLDGFVGKYVIWEDELQKYKNKNEMIDNG